MKLVMTMLLTFAIAAMAVPAGSQAAHGWKRCGRIGFTKSSDDLASKIRARGTSCRRARKVVRRAHNRGTKHPHGYRCRRRTLDTPLLMWQWRCAKGDRHVKWRKS